MDALWSRLEQVAQSAGKSLHLRAGASASAVDSAEKALGRALPEDYKQSILLHDGQDQTSEAFPFLPGSGLLAPLEHVVRFHADLVELESEYREEAEAEGEDYDAVDDAGVLRYALYHSARVPIAGYPHWDGDNTCLDFAPGPNGTAGQLIGMCSESEFVRLGSTFSEVLNAYVDALESGAWVFDAAVAKVRPADGLKVNSTLAFSRYLATL